MAIFDSNKVQNLTFYIVLSDAEQVAALNAEFPNGINGAPYIPGPPASGVGYDYDAPWMGLAAPGAHLPPYSYTDWPSSPSKPFPTDVATFQRHTGGFLGIGGTTTRYYWIGKFQYMPDPVEGGEGGGTSFAATPKRLFVEGFETPGRGAILGNDGEYAITDASRHTGGRGLAIRGQASTTYSLAPTAYGVTPADVTEQWERFYIRLRKLPSSTVNFWRYATTPSAGVGHVLGITADGGLALFSSNSSSVLTLVTVIPGVTFEVWNGRLNHDVWAKIDVVYKVGTGGSIKVYVNSELKYTGAVPTGPTAITSSSMGAPNITSSDLELDVDDWSASDWPKTGGTFAISKDFINGTKIALIRPRTLDAATTGWTGDVRVLGQNAFAFTPAELTSSTSGALVVATTDAAEVIENDPGVGGFGAAAIAVIAYSKRGGAPSGSLGYSIAGAAAVDQAVTQSASLGGNGIVYSTQSASDENPFPDVTPVLLRHTKAADATAATIASLMGVVELVGKWTRADYRAAELEALGEGGDTDYPPGVDSDGVLQDPEAYFWDLIGRNPGEAADDWEEVLTASAIPTGYAPGVVPFDNGYYGLTQQIGADGVRGRLFLPTASPDGLGYYSHPVDLLSGTAPDLVWAWTDLGGPAYSPVDPEGASRNFNLGTGPHNTPYPRTPWARRGLSAPIGTYIAHAGTYTGNGTGQDLTFRQPIHWLWIRPTSGSYGGGALWLSSAISGRTGHQAGAYPGVTFAEADPAFTPGDGENVQQFQFRVRIAGADQDLNAVGVTYQYVAISDPAMRYLVCGSLAHKSTEGPIDNHLAVPDFEPEFMMLQAEQLTSSTTKRLYLKGPAQSAANITNFTPAAPIAGVTFDVGKFISDAPLHALTASQSYAVWRRADGLNSPSQAAVVAFGTYTGDGSASRTVNTSPASGRRPMFVLVYSETSGSGATRDPSHTGTTSHSHTGAALASTGITAGQVDGFSVGSALNTNGVVFGYFVVFAIDGCTGNNGWGCNGEHIPVEPETPVGPGPWPGNPGVPVSPIVPGEGEEGGFPGGDPDDSVDFSVACAPWSTYLANLALARIGVSHQIADIATEVSEPAYKARLNYPLAMDSVLRDFPWAFATRYANLVLVAGTATVPVNKDWQYSYRVPTNMVAARRIVSQEYEQRGFDPDPPKFRIGSDATGLLIYTNAVSSSEIPVQLEYTTRMTCPAQQGDPLFKEAFVWKLAGVLARIIARDTKKADDCDRQYRMQIAAAKEVSANEQQQDNQGGDAPWIRAR